MKAKTIVAILSKKFAEFVASIEDEDLRKRVEQNTIITGGAIASMLLKEKVSDFDLYFRDKDTTLAVAQYYVKKFLENPPPRFKDSDKVLNIQVVDKDGRIKVMVKSAGVASETSSDEYEYFEQDRDPGSTAAAEYVEAAAKIVRDTEEAESEGKKDQKPKYRPVFMSSNAITLSDKIQLVTRFYGEPDEIHANYDFVHCTNYWQSWDKRLVLRQAALEALLARELRYVGSKYPLCSIIRTRKFIARGWTINAGQYVKMAMQLNDLNLNSLAVLEDQLTGVDTAYFMEIIRALRERDNETLDRAYLLELIDKLF